MESMLVLDNMSAIKTEKERSDNKASREFYTAYFSDPANPFAKQRQRNVFQVHSADGETAFWKGGSPEKVKGFLGKEIPGYIKNCKVEAYSVGENTGITNATVIILSGENEAAILKQEGFVLDTSTPVAAAPEKVAKPEGAVSMNA